jgi:hypothetical protein
VTDLTSNNALERTVRRCGWRAAGARRDFTPAARGFGLARSAQRGRSMGSPEAPLRIPVITRGMNQWRSGIFHGT